MSTLQANNYEQALKEVQSLDPSLIGKVNQEIKDSEKKFYHIILVKITDRPGQAKNKVTITTQHFHKEGFNKLKRNFAYIGFNKIIVLHNPENNQIEEINPNVDSSLIPPTVKTPEEIEKEIEERANKMFAEKMKVFEGGEPEKPIVPESTDSKEPVTLDQDQQIEFFGKATVVELKQYAKDNEIELSGLTAKEDIKNAILTWYKDKINEVE